MTNWLIDRWIDWYINWMTGWLTGWLEGKQIGSQTDRLTKWLKDRQTNYVIVIEKPFLGNANKVCIVL